MAIVSGGFTTPIAHPRIYKLAMALTTATVVHLFTPIGLVRFYFYELALKANTSPLLETAAVIAVYVGAIILSQVMAAEVSSRGCNLNSVGHTLARRALVESRRGRFS